MVLLHKDNPVGGADMLNSLADVNINNPEDKQILLYDNATRTWRNYEPSFVDKENVLSTVEECSASTNPEDVAGASAISALNSRMSVTTFSAAVDITNRTSYANAFVCPTDGYLRLISGSNVNDYVIAQVSGSNADVGFNVSAKTQVTNYSEYNGVYVRKGMKCYLLAKSGSDSTLSFRGFEETIV